MLSTPLDIATEGLLTADPLAIALYYIGTDVYGGIDIAKIIVMHMVLFSDADDNILGIFC